MCNLIKLREKRNCSFCWRACFWNNRTYFKKILLNSKADYERYSSPTNPTDPNLPRHMKYIYKFIKDKCNINITFQKTNMLSLKHHHSYHHQYHHLHHCQGREWSWDDLNDNKSKPHWDGRERQGEVKKIWFSVLIKKYFYLKRFYICLKIGEHSWQGGPDCCEGMHLLRIFYHFIFLSSRSLFLYQTMELCF